MVGINLDLQFVDVETVKKSSFINEVYSLLCSCCILILNTICDIKMESVTPVKRQRSTNFTQEEKRLCLQLIGKYSSIIENKKTDGATKQKKDQAWKFVTDEFNATSPSLVSRTCEALKNMYENQKRSARKYAAEEKSQRRKTGGGSADVKEDPLMDITLSILNPKTVEGLPSKFDCDSTLNNTPTSASKIHDNVWRNFQQNLLEEEEEIETIINAPKETTPCESLKEAEVPEVSFHSEGNVTNTNMKRKAWANRRRPLGTTTGNLAKTYEDLSLIKKEISGIQLKILKRQYDNENAKRQADKEREDELCTLKKEVLLSEIRKNKEEELYWKQRREQDAIKFETEKQVLLMDLRQKQLQVENREHF